MSQGELSNGSSQDGSGVQAHSAATEASLDLPWLDQWIQPRHLEPDRIVGYRQSFGSRGRVLVVEDFLRNSVFQQVARFLAEKVEFTPVYGLFSDDCDRDTWHQAPETDRFYRYQKIDHVLPEHQLSLDTVTFLKLRSRLQQAGFKSYLEEISGLRLGACMPPRESAYRRGDFLKRHSDDVGNRRLTVILYLSPIWKRSFGGSLIMAHGKKEIEFPPIPNSLVIFDVTTGQEHFIAPVEPSALHHRRLALSCWFRDSDPSS